ncbi:hypothetical protein DPPLL_00180 [Desulfofustis limnaeus]|uniref:Uncharacterized protein n=1 Tax=Desulfofustis limnaeus TaxID=2740163 RepID=A0ABM7W475_9BACT|nr:hypothetical protein DPPLL_00180 [Desulfofustis limnaeus]
MAATPDSLGGVGCIHAVCDPLIAKPWNKEEQGVLQRHRNTDEVMASPRNFNQKENGACS